MSRVGVLCFLMVSVPAVGDTFVVDRTDDDGALSACTDSPLDCSLRGALQAANLSAGPDQVVIPAGTYLLSQVSPDFDFLRITSEVTVRGAGMDETFISPSSGFASMAIAVEAGGDLTLEDVTLSGFAPMSSGDGGTSGSTGPGGALWITGELGARSQLNRVRIEDSEGRGGGAIIVSRSEGGFEPEFRLQLIDSIVSNNRATSNIQDCSGGGIAIFGGHALIQNTVIRGNRTVSDARRGGGICAQGAAALTVVDSLIAANAAESSGGGIYVESTSLEIHNTTIQENEVLNSLAGDGGGLTSMESDVLITNSRFESNVNRTSFTASTLSHVGNGTLVLQGAAVVSDLGNQYAVSFRDAKSTRISDTEFSGRGAIVVVRDTPLSMERVSMMPWEADLPAILLRGASLVAIDLFISKLGGETRQGSAIDAADSVLRVFGCHFDGHRAVSVAGDSTSGTGGALYAEGSDVELSGCTFDANTADVSGGAISLRDQSSLSVINSTFSNNVAGRAEALNITQFSDAALRNVTIADPNGSTQVEVTISTLTLAGSAVEGTCSLFASGGDTDSLGGNVVTTESCRVFGAGDSLTSDLLLHPLALNGGATPTHLPRIASPLLETGFSCPAEDQRGQPRGEPCDAGAVERVQSDNNLFLDGFEW